MDPAMEYEVQLLSKQQAMMTATERGDSRVQRFYAGSVVLVTGSSGFLGKQLVEKLLRSCPKVKKVYLLLREKKAVDIQTRLELILENPVFEALRKQQPKFEQKLVTIAGDTSEIGLGLSEKDRRIITEEVDVIFHEAATTRLDESLKRATNTNVRGAREMLLLARDCKNLRSIVYVSTAYSGATKDLIDSEVLEKFYNSPIDPNALIEMVNSMDDETLEDITPKLIQGWPNTYTFSKRVAEELVRTLSDGLPLCVVRPTIIIGTYNEPSPGWIEPSCAYGATGILLGSGLGVVHVLIASPECAVDLVPADLVNNLTLVAACDTARRFADGERNINIYTMSSSKRNPLLFGQIRSIVTKEMPEIIRNSPKTVYHKFGVETTCKPLAYVLYWLFHYIPGYLVDGILLLMGKKPILNKVYTKAWKLTSVLSHFLTHQWTFGDDNTKQLYERLSRTDKEIFNFDVTCYDWIEMHCIWALGIRKYILKDGLQDTVYAIRKQRWLRIAHYVVTALYAYFWWKVFNICAWMLSVLFRL